MLVFLSQIYGFVQSMAILQIGFKPINQKFKTLAYDIISIIDIDLFRIPDIEPTVILDIFDILDISCSTHKMPCYF